MKGWRTIVANILMGILGFVQAQGPNPVIPTEYVPLVIAAVNLVLRYLTTTPIGRPV